MRRGALLVALALALPLRADDRLYERSGWDLTGSQRGTKPVLSGVEGPVLGEGPAVATAPPSAATPTPAPAPAKVAPPVIPPAPDPFERSPAFERHASPRSVWTSGDRPGE